MTPPRSGATGQLAAGRRTLRARCEILARVHRVVDRVAVAPGRRELRVEPPFVIGARLIDLIPRLLRQRLAIMLLRLGRKEGVDGALRTSRGSRWARSQGFDPKYDVSQQCRASLQPVYPRPLPFAVMFQFAFGH
jgi:hypothetical protein